LTPREAQGFTLMEVLVAMVIVGLVVVVFFQLLSGSLGLELKSRQKMATALLARETFDDLLRQDVRDDGFVWEGTVSGHPWTLAIAELDAVAPDSPGAPDEIRLQHTTELYAFTFTMYDSERRASAFRLYLEQSYATGHFTEEFRRRYLPEPEAAP